MNKGLFKNMRRLFILNDSADTVSLITTAHLLAKYGPKDEHGTLECKITDLQCEPDDVMGALQEAASQLPPDQHTLTVVLQYETMAMVLQTLSDMHPTDLKILRRIPGSIIQMDMKSWDDLSKKQRCMKTQFLSKSLQTVSL